MALYATPPMARIAERVKEFEQAGLAIPQELTRLIEAWRVISSGVNGTADTTAEHDKILAAAVDGDMDTVRTTYLTLAAWRSVSRSDHAGPRDAVAKLLVDKARPLLHEVAAKGLPTLAKRFNTAARKLAECGKAVTLDADPGTLVGEDERVRTSWIHAPEHARVLDDLAPVITLSAVTLGYANGTGLAVQRPPAALFVDPGEHDQGAILDAWEDTPHRLGKWGALVDMGVTIRAVSSLDEVTPIVRPPKPEIRYVRKRMPNGFTGMVPEEVPQPAAG